MLFYDLCYILVFFFKQKTAYEMRISDWSSDVCSSDLTRLAAATAGDDYQLLFTADPGAANDIRAIAAALNVAATPIGHAGVGDGITLTHRAQRIAPPERLGFMH